MLKVCRKKHLSTKLDLVFRFVVREWVDFWDMCHPRWKTNIFVRNSSHSWCQHFNSMNSICFTTKKGTQVLTFQQFSWSQRKHQQQLARKRTNHPPTFFFPQLTCYPSLSDRTAEKSHHHQWKNNIYGFSFGYATICNLHMPTSTPSKDNILAPTSSCTWPKQCKAGVICESRSNRAWHPQWKKPSWPSLKGWNRLLTTVFLIVDAYWCLLMGDVIMNLMAEPEMWKWLWINMPVRQHDMRKTSTKTKTWFTLTYI